MGLLISEPTRYVLHTQDVIQFNFSKVASQTIGNFEKPTRFRALITKKWAAWMAAISFIETGGINRPRVLKLFGHFPPTIHLSLLLTCLKSDIRESTFSFIPFVSSRGPLPFCFVVGGGILGPLRLFYNNVKLLQDHGPAWCS